MSVELEDRARAAAAAARVSVAAAADGAVQRGAPARHRAGAWGAALAAAVIVLAGVAALVGGRNTATQLETGPAAEGGPSGSAATALRPRQPVTTLPAPPAVPPPLPLTGPPVGSGTASDGRRWTLSIGGPSNELCLQVFLDERHAPGTCAGRPGGSAVPAEERYRPLRFQDLRLPQFVFGRMPADVAEVEVELRSSRTRRVAVIAGEGGGDGFYAVELEREDEPRAVIGVRRDGTTLRHPLSG